MKQLVEFNAVIFDMDGLVLDTELSYFSAWQEAAESLGYPLSNSFCANLSGLAFAQISEKFNRYFPATFPFVEFHARSSHIWREKAERDGIAVKKGARQLLQLLTMRKIPYCLATNSPEANARECLAYAAIDDFFSIMICRDHVSAPKPAPDLFLYAAKLLNQRIEQCIVLEDSLTGILAARRAKAFSILVPSMPDIDGKAGALADLVVNDLSEVSRLLQG